MPRFEPFTATRYAPGLPLDLVAAPPYDVLSEADVERLRALHPSNIVHVDVPREADGPARYDDAAALLRRWLSEGTMARDGQPSFTLYRMAFTDSQGRSRNTVGVLGALEVIEQLTPAVMRRIDAISRPVAE